MRKVMQTPCGARWLRRRRPQDHDDGQMVVITCHDQAHGGGKAKDTRQRYQ